jgi:UDP-N-acetylmuramate dehydrogenase
MEYENEEELRRILNDEYFAECRSLHIGEGSNLLFVNDFDGIILHSAIKGIEIVDDTPKEAFVRIGAAEKWDDVVAFAVSNGLGGAENMSDIPGETGAAAVQNIGAYGAEIKDIIASVEAYNQLTTEKQTFNAKECEYGYRSSFFKNPSHEPHIVTHVTLRLLKKPAFNLIYSNLKDVIEGRGDELTLQAVRDTVISIRHSKLPDTETLGSAGSFFTNPIVPVEMFLELKTKYTGMPSYPAGDGKMKISAGWLIEKCGFKGRRLGNTGCYAKQALVIVNYGGATGYEIADYAESIVNAVQEKFGIRLTPEVKIIE